MDLANSGYYNNGTNLGEEFIKKSFWEEGVL